MLKDEIYKLCCRLFPICRSITGNGVRQTLDIIREYIPIKKYEIATGVKAFDWEIPEEWNIKDAYVLDEQGHKIIDFKQNNLHVVGYSIPVNKAVSLAELQEHLYSLPDMPQAIPYITSYYKRTWGFCIRHDVREKLKPGQYKVVIDSELKQGFLTYGELIIPGKIKEEVFLSTYICHPSMANNELSGPAVTTFLAKWILQSKKKYTYRIIFIPETIGSIAYLSRNSALMKERVVAGFNITCIGDDRRYSYLASRNAQTLADKIALHVLKHTHPDFTSYSFLDRGSDERQYCSPGIDLPVCSVMRTKYLEYPEYHTSLDNLDVITSDGLFGGYAVLKRCIECIELNDTFKTAILCEPQLGKRSLYPFLSRGGVNGRVKDIVDILAYSDGKYSLLDIAEMLDIPLWEISKIVEKLQLENLLIKV